MCVRVCEVIIFLVCRFGDELVIICLWDIWTKIDPYMFSLKINYLYVEVFRSGSSMHYCDVIYSYAYVIEMGC